MTESLEDGIDNAIRIEARFGILHIRLVLILKYIGQTHGPDFEAGIWSRVSQIESRQLARGRNGLAAIMLVTALSVGMISGGNEAIASSGSSYLSDGPDYSPATLLHVLP